MAFENLNPLAALWHGTGLRYILSDRNVTISELHEAEIAPRAIAGPASSPRRAGFVPPRPRQPQAQRAMQTKADVKADKWQPTPPESWPLAWQTRLAQTKKGRIAWNYADLGTDLLAVGQTTNADANARALRSKLLRRILSDLRHPVGTHTFWPSSLESGLESDLFWSGLSALGCRGTIIMGPEHASALMGRETSCAYCQLKYRNKFVWILPEIDNLPETDYRRMLDCLKRGLHFMVAGA